MTYAFTFDETFCTGCRDCQAACKEKHDLPGGVTWRRVYEISGGEWTQTGDTWTSTVFSYNLTLACNHCVHPRCAGVCPTDAYLVRPDGIVFIDPSKCIGCGYCAWACPYDAPQMDPSTRVMTKCDLCQDNLALGQPPACVSACPEHCLEVVQITDIGLESKGLELWKIPGEQHPFPLPRLSRTEPHLVIKPVPAVDQASRNTVVCNLGVIATPSVRRELPLIIFSLLMQMAVGAFGTILLIDWGLLDSLRAWQITILPLVSIGVMILGAFLASLFHLGKPIKAWQAVIHLRKSWLSREILFTSGFAGSWLILAGLMLFRPSSSIRIAVEVITAVCGLVAIYCMQRVYQLRSVPGWNTNRTWIDFSISTVGLGCLLTGSLLPRSTPSYVLVWIALLGLVTFSIAGLVNFFFGRHLQERFKNWRACLLLLTWLGLLVMSVWPSIAGLGGMVLVLIISLFEEAIGRWQFFSRRTPGISSNN
jgi:anaerobic dimethyl sulfoxide reductase subunit B (iron-sulfur subunit)